MELTPDDIKTIREMRRWIQTNGQAGTVRPQYTRKPPRMLLPVDKLYFYNNSGETAPAFGCLQITGVTEIDNRYFLTAEKPSGNSGVFVFNSGSDVANAKTGVCHAGPVVKALVVPSDGDSTHSANTLYNGECIGPDGWELASTPGGPQRFLGRLDDYSVDNVAFVLNRPASDCDDSSSDSDSVCQGIPGVDLDALATVNAADVDYVLAIKDGCLVKVSLSECDNSGSV
jgi:hypothetical protein